MSGTQVPAQKPGQGRLTLRDLARHCGVSKSTVSLALNLGPEVCPLAPRTRERVLAEAMRLGYRPSWRGRLLANGRSHAISLVYRGITPYLRGIYGEIYHAAAEALFAQGYHLLFVPLPEDEGDWQSLLNNHRFDGMLAVQELPASMTALIRKTGLPTVMVNAWVDEPFSRVLFDDQSGARTLTEHLLELGHRRIWFCLDPSQPKHYSREARQAGYEQALGSAGLGDQRHVVADLDAAGLAEAMAQASPPPTAVISWSHGMAIRLLKELWRHNVQVPAQVSVASFNDVPPTADVIPPLTVMGLPTAEMGRRAARLILEQVQSTSPAEQVTELLGERLVVRESTGPAPTG